MTEYPAILAMAVFKLTLVILLATYSRAPLRQY